MIYVQLKGLLIKGDGHSSRNLGLNPNNFSVEGPKTGFLLQPLHFGSFMFSIEHIFMLSGN